MKNRVILVVDLGFGDSGKGTIVEYLAARHDAQWVVRFNGGPQAGHNVVLRDGRHHTFAQFGSASFQHGVRTLLSRFMAVDPYAMLNEAAHLNEIGVTDALSRTAIDERCLVITPAQQIGNRLRERARAELAHGTCGMGFGECVGDALARPELAVRMADLRSASVIREKLRRLLEYKREEVAAWKSLASADEIRVLDDSGWIETAVDVYGQLIEQCELVNQDRVATVLRDSSCTIFEGAQGVLLDERYGFHPHTSWSKTTFTNAAMLLRESGVAHEMERIGVLRPYLTRHGNGPLITENRRLDQICEAHNSDSGWPGRFRRGLLDLVMLRYAIQACGPLDTLALTCADHLKFLPPLACEGYEAQDGAPLELSMREDLLEMERQTRRLITARPRYRDWPPQSVEAFCVELEKELGVRAAYLSFGPTKEEKVTR
jgi:adenylosuccinate synthase